MIPLGRVLAAVVLLGVSGLGLADRTAPDPPSEPPDELRAHEVLVGETDAPVNLLDGIGALAAWGQGILDARARADREARQLARWEAVHNCEQPGDWYADGWTAHGHFQGGLGISVDAWAENDDGLPGSALEATPYEQTLVADRILARHGPGAWACPGVPSP